MRPTYCLYSRVPVYHEARHVTLTADDKHALISYKDKVTKFGLSDVYDTNERCLCRPLHSFGIWSYTVELSFRRSAHVGMLPVTPRITNPVCQTFLPYRIDTHTLRSRVTASPQFLASSVVPMSVWFFVPGKVRLIVIIALSYLFAYAHIAGYPPPTATNKAPALKGDAADDTPNVSPGEIFCWDRDTAILIHRLAFPYEYGFLTSLAWNPAPNTWMLVTGTHNGAIQIWSTDVEPNVAVFPHKGLVESPRSTLGSPITIRTPTAVIPRHRSRFTTSGGPISVSAGGSEATSN